MSIMMYTCLYQFRYADQNEDCVSGEKKLALTGVAQWVGHHPTNWKDWFDSQSGHKLGLRARFLVGGM